jgi:hypothetical protein
MAFSAETLKSTVTSAATSGFSILTLVIIVMCLFGVAFGILQLIKWIKRYNIPVTIIDHTVTPAIIDFDKAGYTVDRVTKLMTLTLRDYKMRLSADKIPFQGGKNKCVFLDRWSKTQFTYWIPPMHMDSPYKDSIGPEDVTNATNQFHRNIKLRNISLMSQLIQYAPIAISCALLLIMIILVGKFLPDIVRVMSTQTKAQLELTNAMKTMYQTTCGTTVIPVS